MAEFCMAFRLTQLWSMAILSKNISQGSVATHEGWENILLSLYYKFIAKSASNRILKIGQHLAKLVAKI